MTQHDCPTALQERHEDDIKALYERSLPAWTRALIMAALAFLVTAYGAAWAYSAITYATKDEAKEIKNELKEMRAEIRADLKEISGKLEASRTK